MRAVFGAAILAGLAAGTLASLLQEIGLVPLLRAAEGFEAGAAHVPDAGLVRHLLTWAANLVTATGFALLLAGAFALRRHAPDWREGLVWGLGGFVAFSLAPALGLPPELPGMSGADLADRQAWWALAAAATAAGLVALAFAPAVWKAGAVLLLALPHLVGAPAAETSAGIVPAELAARFATAALATALVFWAALGALTASFYRRI